MILVVDDDAAILASISMLLEDHDFEIRRATDPDEARPILASGTVSLFILDMNFTIDTTGDAGLEFLREIKKTHPLLPVILITAWGHMSLAIEGMKAGAADFINKPWDNRHLLESIHTALQLSSPNVPEKNRSRKALDNQYRFGHIIGQDPRIIQILHMVARISPTHAPALITGESGTGKELIAEAIHENSQRRQGPFIKVNLGAIPAPLFESELFGHVRGAFTDAVADRPGRFEEADKGTLFLDEIGELEPVNQVKLLRVLQERRFEPVGSSKTRTVDVRIIAATNQNLNRMVREGSFREDLLYRINLITIDMPPLRERPGDIPLLVSHLLETMKKLYQRPRLQITTEAMTWLGTLPWPGNIRELKNLVERSVLLSEEDLLDIRHFRNRVQPAAGKARSLPAVGEMSLEEVEVEMIKRAMAFHQGNITEAARSLGLSRNALYRRLEKYGLDHET